MRVFSGEASRPRTRDKTNYLRTSALKHFWKGEPVKTARIDDLLHWAFVREKVENARQPGLDLGVILKPRGWSRSASSEQIGAGGRASGNIGYEAPRDAYVVAKAVRTLPRDAAKTVLDVTWCGSPPDWIPDPQVRWEKGPPLYGRYGKKRHRLIGYAVTARGDVPAIVDEARAHYLEWAWAMTRLHADLSSPGVLRDHQLDQWLPPAEPWVRSCPIDRHTKT